MIEVTAAAAKQIKRSQRQGDLDELALRIAARREPDGSISYVMGFDEIAEGDAMIASRGVDILISRPDKVLLQGTVLDYVELDSGELNFVFLNPNDPSFVPPRE